MDYLSNIMYLNSILKSRRRPCRNIKHSNVYLAKKAKSIRPHRKCDPFC